MLANAVDKQTRLSICLKKIHAAKASHLKSKELHEITFEHPIKSYKFRKICHQQLFRKLWYVMTVFKSGNLKYL